MASGEQKKSAPNRRGAYSKQAATRTRIRRIYERVSGALETLEDMPVPRDEQGISNPADSVLHAVLEDDLRALVEESEDYLITGYYPDLDELASFDARSVTVLEEYYSLKQRLGPPVPHSHLQAYRSILKH